MNKIAATCGNLDFNADQFEVKNGCVTYLPSGATAFKALKNSSKGEVP